MYTKHSWFYKVTEPFFASLENFTPQFVGSVSKARWIAFPIILICASPVFSFINHCLLRQRQWKTATVYGQVSRDRKVLIWLHRQSELWNNTAVTWLDTRKNLWSCICTWFWRWRALCVSFIAWAWWMQVKENVHRIRLPSKWQECSSGIIMWAFALQEQTISVGLGGRGAFLYNLF